MLGCRACGVSSDQKQGAGKLAEEAAPRVTGWEGLNTLSNPIPWVSVEGHCIGIGV